MTEPECECSVSRLRVNDGYEHDETCPLLIWHAFNEMSDDQRGDDRNDDGWCTVCNAEPWMWCDLVAHRQHDERAAGELWFDIAQRDLIVEVHPRHSGTMSLEAMADGGWFPWDGSTPVIS